MLFESLRRRGWEVQLVCGRSVRSLRGWRVTAETFARRQRTGIFQSGCSQTRRSRPRWWKRRLARGRSYDGLEIGGLGNVEVWDYQEDMRSVHAVTDVLLMPSQWLESFGRVILEAQASGIPVVASNLGGIPFVLGEGGILVRPKTDVEAYVSALRRLFEDPELYDGLSRAAARHVNRSELETSAQVEVFLRVVEEEIEAGVARP